ncbi:unnamed protein product [Calicophoron daubneyi]|uniref:Uncharacterized protein n=1 Tax=Calicophoron daubneyi TaxID=300641 RepID=A0AAV2TB85_CALDB
MISREAEDLLELEDSSPELRRGTYRDRFSTGENFTEVTGINFTPCLDIKNSTINSLLGARDIGELSEINYSPVDCLQSTGKSSDPSSLASVNSEGDVNRSFLGISSDHDLDKLQLDHDYHNQEGSNAESSRQCEAIQEFSASERWASSRLRSLLPPRRFLSHPQGLTKEIP